MDLVRYEIPRDKWRTRQLLDAAQPFCVEVRYVSSRTREKFLGVSRLVTVAKKMAKVDSTCTAASPAVDGFLFTSERWAVTKNVAVDVRLFQAFGTL
jgi:hypothetical protein